MPEGRPAIPEPMKRAVRQRCGFGCVICGVPLITYEHMTPWAEVQEHSEDNLTLLCSAHQRESSDGLLPKNTIREANANPFNLQAGQSTPFHLHFGPGEKPVMAFGRNEFTSSANFLAPMIIDNQTPLLFTRTEDELLLNITILNRFNEPILGVFQNELTFAVGLWDITFIAGRLAIRDGQGDISYVVRFEAPNKFVIERAHLYYNGVELEVTEETVLVQGNVANIGANWFDHPVGFTIGFCPGWPPPVLGLLRLRIDRHRPIQPPAKDASKRNA